MNTAAWSGGQQLLLWLLLFDLAEHYPTSQQERPEERPELQNVTQIQLLLVESSPRVEFKQHD
jgi:hypothetical protein